MGGYDVLTIGRSGVDLYPLQFEVGLEDVESFGKYLGGSPTNVAVAAARYGLRSAVVTRTGDDPFGRFVRTQLRVLGVDDAFVRTVEGLPTPVTFCEVFPPDRFPLYFYRYPKAPDLEIRREELPLEEIRGAKVFWATLTGLSQEPSRSATVEALAARDRRDHTVIDLDYRPMFWGSVDEARTHARKALLHATAAVGNADECEVAVGERDADAAASALLELGIGLAIVKRGPDGVLARTATQSIELPPHPVEVVNGLGAGDGFGGALCYGLLAGWPLEEVVRFANAAGALVAAQLECSTAMPTERDVRSALAKAKR